MDEDATPPADDLDALVARVDPDRWLSSRLIADAQDRAEAAGALWALGRLRLAGEPSLSPEHMAPLRAQAKGLGVAAFPAGAHGVLARVYGRGREPSPVGKRWRITLAALTGRI